MPAKRTSGHQIQDEATTLAQANFLNFTGAGVSAATAAGTTTVTISGGAGATCDDESCVLHMAVFA